METKNKLTSLRVQKGLSQAELAEQVHVTRQAVSRWECGKSYPNNDTLNALARLYGVPLSCLLDDEAELTERKEEPKQETGPKKKGAAIALAALGLLLLLALAACIFGNRPVQKTESTELTFGQLDVDHVQSDSIDGFDLDW